MNERIKISLVDDHALLRSGLASIVVNLGYDVLFECSNGKELIKLIDKDNLPDIVLMDINMPGMDGFEATLWLRENYPLVNVIALSMYDDDISIIRMLKNGAHGFVLKDISPVDLQRAINEVMNKGFHYTELVTGPLLHSIQNKNGKADKAQITQLNPRETAFLKLICTEMTYKEIADKMSLSPRTIDGYRDDLFQKLDCKSRVGLVIYAIKNRIVHF
jgi:two-component system invasion response regulator UvrY